MMCDKFEMQHDIKELLKDMEKKNKEYGSLTPFEYRSYKLLKKIIDCEVLY